MQFAAGAAPQLDRRAALAMKIAHVEEFSGAAAAPAALAAAGLSLAVVGVWVSARRGGGGPWLVVNLEVETVHSGDARVLSSPDFRLGLEAFLGNPDTPIHRHLFLNDCSPGDFALETDPTLVVAYEAGEAGAAGAAGSELPWAPLPGYLP